MFQDCDLADYYKRFWLKSYAYICTHMYIVMYTYMCAVYLLYSFRNGEKVLMNSSAGYSVKCLPTQMDEVSLATGARSSLILTLS